MATKLDSRRATAWRRLLEAHAAVLRRLEDELVEECDLPLAWYEVLYHLGHAPDGRLRMQELARSILLTPSGLTRLVDRLEAAKLVRREKCPSDRRGYFAAITAAGRRRLAEAEPIHQRGIDAHFARHLDETEADVLADVFARVVDELDEQ